MTSVQLLTDRDPVERLRLARELKSLPSVASVTDNERARDTLVTLILEVLQYSIVGLVLMSGVIFFGSILTSSLITVAERQRDIGTLIAMGYDSGQVSGIFLRESMLVNVTGALAGLPLGWWTCVAIAGAYQSDLYRLPLTANPLSFLAAMLLAVVFTVLAHGFARRAVVKLDWRGAIGMKE